MAAVTICSNFEAQENKAYHCFQFFPIYLPWSDGTRCHDLSFLNVEFYASFLNSCPSSQWWHPTISSSVIPSPPAFTLSQNQGPCQWVSSSHQVAKIWSFTFSINPFNEYSCLISFRIDRLDLLAVQGTLKSLLQHCSSKASILRRSAFFMVQLSHPYLTTKAAWHQIPWL